jgi:hypothetical protein
MCAFQFTVNKNIGFGALILSLPFPQQSNIVFTIFRANGLWVENYHKNRPIHKNLTTKFDLIDTCICINRYCLTF